MKKTVFLCFLGFCFLIGPVAAGEVSEPTKLNMGTFNIRIQTPGDTAARSWNNRKTNVAKIIKKYNFDVFGVQEIVNSKQEADLKALIPAYTYVGNGRDNNEGTTGERLGVFYKTSRFTLKDKGFFFLSKTPETMSIGWDAALNRICLWTKLYDRENKTTFFVFCTHFDHMGTLARAESAKLIVRKIKVLAGESPVICVGDFNASPEETEMYDSMTVFLNDSREIALIPAKGFAGTFNGYDMTSATFPEKNRIDYIFCRKVKVLSYKTLTERYTKGSYPSDHFPVMVECELIK